MANINISGNNNHYVINVPGIGELAMDGSYSDAEVVAIAHEVAPNVDTSSSVSWEERTNSDGSTYLYATITPKAQNKG